MSATPTAVPIWCTSVHGGAYGEWLKYNQFLLIYLFIYLFIYFIYLFIYLFMPLFGISPTG